jgi:hypothetical protein
MRLWEKPMAGTALTLTPPLALGLFFIHRYRFLTISQFAKAAGLSRERSEDVLYALFRRGIVDAFGNVTIPGHGKTPKMYFLKRKGYELLRMESGIPEELIGSYSEVHQEATWSPQMYHRLRLLDVLIALEVQVRDRLHLSLVKTFVEYRRVKRGNRIARETTDFVQDPEIPENRIIPDGAFVMENVETGRRALFFIEMDMATERIITKISNDKRMTLRFKFEQYDRYLQSRRFAQTYAKYGAFTNFTLLFITLKQERVDNLREAVTDLPAEFSAFYRLAVFDRVVEDFLGEVWQSRLATDERRYRLTLN